MRNRRLLSLIVLSVLTCTLSQHSAASDTAPIMRLADKSLLLDIDTAGPRLVVAGERGHILFSDDNGTSWTQGTVPTSQMLTAVHFVDDRYGWAVGHDGLILASDDAGSSWRIQRDGLAAQHQLNLELREQALHQIEVIESELQQTAEQVEGRAEAELALEDARMDLEDANLALEEDVFTSPLMDIWFQDRDHGWAIGAFGTILATNDGGRHWSSIAQRIDNPDEFHLNSVTGDGHGRVFIAGEGGVLFRSDNGGKSWKSLPHFYDGSWFGLLYHPGEMTLLVFGLQGTLYRSIDFGETWSMVPNDIHITLSGGTVSDSGNIIIAGGVGTVLKSTDAGASFRATAIPDRLSLSGAQEHSGQILLVGQGGIKTLGGEK